MTEKTLLNKIKNIVIGRDPSAKVYLYGSRARGESKSDSDWDILILLNREQITAEIEKNITSPLYDLEFETGEVISPMIYAEQDWNTRHKFTPFYYSVMKEGKLL